MAWGDLSADRRKVLTMVNASPHACQECGHAHQPKFNKGRGLWLKQVCSSCPCREYVKP